MLKVRTELWTNKNFTQLMHCQKYDYVIMTMFYETMNKPF